ncbi:hypothetical protein G6F22_002283 [Rhizopus arrhizus]|nr:hypothetical protein G6F22_002283 [Rhizopus arrhizus]KAG1116775.1 hypothetical protein G6F40_003427 [Rhizopus arrhizus]
MEINSTGASQNSRTKNSGHGINHTILDDSTLVSNVTQDEAKGQSNSIPTGQVEYERLEIIGKKRRAEDLNDEEISYLQQIHRKNTQKVYNVGWRKWVEWCHRQDPTISPVEYNVSDVFKFLMANRHYSLQYLNGIRSAVASVFKIIHVE